MNRKLELLLQLEELVLQRETVSWTGALYPQDDQKVMDRKIRKLRCQLPGPVLSEYDRLSRVFADVVSVVADGVCQGCRWRIPRRLVGQLEQSSEVLHCPHCGRFLLAEENMPDFVVPA
jgi:predicted  nucleic acid-binding Zn-ribbon protein